MEILKLANKYDLSYDRSGSLPLSEHLSENIKKNV